MTVRGVLKNRKRNGLSPGMTLVEVLVTFFLFFMILVFIGSLYKDSTAIYKRVDFQQIAQKTAGVIIETIAREVRGSVRIEGPNYGLIPFPIDTGIYPPWQGPSPGRTKHDTPNVWNPASYGGSYPYVVFTNNASPVDQVNIFYHYAKDQLAIFYYTRLGTNIPYCAQEVPVFRHQPGDSTYPMIKKFSSDPRVVIENFEVWSAPDGVILRIQLTDRSYTHDFNYDTDTPAAGGENKFFSRPIVNHAAFIAIRYYQ